MSNLQNNEVKEIFAIKISQWLSEWDKVDFDEEARRKRPDPYFYFFKLSASNLKALSGISRRSVKNGIKRESDLGIQRRHDKDRSDEIREFVKFGFPWSELTEAKRNSGKYNDLRKPGWLPTAIVVNIKTPGDVEVKESVAKSDFITLLNLDNGTVKIRLPENFTGENWKPKNDYPIDIIDGQHRLWAFENNKSGRDFELPVVAFYGLDLSWQAYLFWTINIKPKRINASLAYDLYPLLRSEDWLDRFAGHPIYRESRAQELTAALWGQPESPWYLKINMLGEPGEKIVSQAAWIRSLMASYIKSWSGHLGGLFGAPIRKDQTMLSWSGAQQAAFLIFIWSCIEKAINKSKHDWAESLRKEEEKINEEDGGDLAFLGPHSLLRTDQGVRGVLLITNDFCFLRSEILGFNKWIDDDSGSATSENDVREAINSIKNQPFRNFVITLCEGIAGFDWRTSSAEYLSDEQRTIKKSYRGSGGYKELRRQLLYYLQGINGEVGIISKEILNILGYENGA